MSASHSNHTSGFEDDEIFDDSTFLANFDNTSFRQKKVPESNVDNSLNTSTLNVRYDPNNINYKDPLI